MKSMQVVQSDGIKRWISVCVMAILIGVFCCQLLNMEDAPISRGEPQRPACSAQADDEDLPADQQTAVNVVERRQS